MSDQEGVNSSPLHESDSILVQLAVERVARHIRNPKKNRGKFIGVPRALRRPILDLAEVDGNQKRKGVALFADHSPEASNWVEVQRRNQSNCQNIKKVQSLQKHGYAASLVCRRCPHRMEGPAQCEFQKQWGRHGLKVYGLQWLLSARWNPAKWVILDLECWPAIRQLKIGVRRSDFEAWLEAWHPKAAALAQACLSALNTIREGERLGLRKSLSLLGPEVQTAALAVPYRIWPPGLWDADLESIPSDLPYSMGRVAAAIRAEAVSMVGKGIPGEMGEAFHHPEPTLIIAAVIPYHAILSEVAPRLRDKLGVILYDNPQELELVRKAGIDVQEVWDLIEEPLFVLSRRANPDELAGIITKAQAANVMGRHRSMWSRNDGRWEFFKKLRREMIECGIVATK